VPSFSHELLVDLFRHRGELAPTLLSAVTGIRLDYARAEPSSIDLSQVTSTEYRADSVVVLRDRHGAATGALIAEVQLGIDPRKRRSWPSYVTTLHARHGCDVILLVLAPDPGVARWARTPILLGHPDFCLTPIVIGFADVPRIFDPKTALKLPELAVLSALAHRRVEIAEAAVAAIFSMDELTEDRTKVYLDVVMSALSPDHRKTLEVCVQGYIYQSDFARRYYFEGREEGVTAGLRAALHTLVHARLEAVSADDQAAIEAVRTQPAATELIAALGRAATSDEVRAILAAVDRASR
jgi:hypothetical protein